ncbi:hypothetical protein COB28_04260 [Candidatus Dependentiae bacterium]|nr:MAG: hypothetical protein COB28_04260 [Candidatus Dependentiae bacterium]
MWMHHYTKVYKGIAQEDVWNIWKDINNWHLWFPEVTTSSLRESFSINTFFSIYFKNKSKGTYRIVKVFDGYKFISIRKFFGAKLYDTRALDSSAEGIRLVRTVVISGPLAWFWRRKISKNILYETSTELESLALYARRTQYLNKQSLDESVSSGQV